jgi:hypothetical protein
VSFRRWLILLAISLGVGLSGVAYDCCKEYGFGCGAGGSGGSGPPGGPVTYKHVVHQFGLGNGNSYFQEMQVYGHFDDAGVHTDFDSVSAENTGEEVCIPGAQDTDWHYFAFPFSAGSSPWELNGEGGYADDWNDCLLGQAVWGYRDTYWGNGTPPISDDYHDASCIELRPLVPEGSPCPSDFPEIP